MVTNKSLKKKRFKDFKFKCKVYGRTYEQLLYNFNSLAADYFRQRELDKAERKDHKKTEKFLKKLRKKVQKANKRAKRDKSSGADILYADPPWLYVQNSKTDTTGGLQGETPYPTMTTDEICSMDLEDIIGDNTNILLMWATAPKWNDAIVVMNAWYVGGVPPPPRTSSPFPGFSAY